MKFRKAVISPPDTTGTCGRRMRRAGVTKRPFPVALCGALILAAIACAVFALPSAAARHTTTRGSRSDLAATGRGGAVVADTKKARTQVVQRETKQATANPSATGAGLFPALMLQSPPPPPAVEAITTYAADCATPKTVFNLGDMVCAKVTDAPFYSLFALRRISWVNTGGLVLQQTDVTVNSATGTATFQLPSTAVSPEGLDRRGGWEVNSVSTADSSVHAQARFTVKDPTAPAANLSVFQFAQGGEAVVAAGAHITYTVILANLGPDDAQNVQLTEGTPALSNGGAAPTFVSNAQLSGPAFTCATDTGCSISTLPAGAVASFNFIFDTDPSIPNNTVITNTASATSNTSEPNSTDNSSIAYATVVGVSTAADCVLECPNDMVVTANTTQGGQSGAFVTFGAADATGDCGTISRNHNSGDFFPVGTTVVTSTSSTGGGSCSFNITVVEGGGPTITCPAPVTTTITDGCDATVDPGTPTASSGATVTADRSDDKDLSDPFPVGTTTITWTATDSVGRSASCTQTVTVNSNDTTPPTITAPPDVNVSTGADGATCGVVVSEATLGRADADDGGCSVSVSRTGVPAGNFFPIGTTTVTWKATDAAGNTATATQQVTVVDNTPPIIFAPPDASYTCRSQVPAASPSQATGPDVLDGSGQPVPGPPSDNCGAPTVTVSETQSGAGSAASPLVITRTFTATDSHGNTASAVQTITVIDPTPPTISAPANITVSNDPGSCSAIVNPGTATAQDNCGTVTVNGVRSDGQALNASYPKGTTTITWTATDASGNTASAQQTVTVNDTEPPVVNVPANIVAYLPLNTTATSMTVTYSVTATDNCPGVVLNVSPASGSVFPVGTTTVTATATDAVGNVTTRTFTVTVLYDFAGFFSPVANPPTFNQVNAGRAIPMKFSLSGNKGLGIFPAGSPDSQQIACDSGAPISDLQDTTTAGSSSLSYDASSDQYNYVWATNSAWAGTCRQFVLTLNDGSSHVAKFKFK